MNSNDEMPSKHTIKSTLILDHVAPILLIAFALTGIYLLQNLN